MSHHFVEQLLHIVWAVKDSHDYLTEDICGELYSYLNPIIKSLNARIFAMNGASDHIHLLIYLPPDISLSEFIRKIKSVSSKWLRSTGKLESDFKWQQGYAAFTVQKNRKMAVINYIQNDRSRHADVSFTQELECFLQKQDIPYTNKYLLNSTYSKLLIHLIWSTKHRESNLNSEIQPKLYDFLKSTLSEMRGKLLEINGIEDHIHLLIDTPRHLSLSDVVKELKNKSHHWIKKAHNSFMNFEWQVGFGAFAVSHTEEAAVREYIENQKKHHLQKSSQEEWKELLQISGLVL